MVRYLALILKCVTLKFSTLTSFLPSHPSLSLEAGRGQIQARGKTVKGESFVGVKNVSGLRLDLDSEYMKNIAFEVKVWG